LIALIVGHDDDEVGFGVLRLRTDSLAEGENQQKAEAGTSG